MKNIIITISIIMSCFVVLKAQNPLTNSDINFQEVNYNSSYVVADSNELVLGATTSLSNNEQETNRLNFIVYGNLKKIGLGIGAKVNSRFRNFYKTVSAEVFLAKTIQISEKSDFNLGINFGLNSNGINESYFNNYVDLGDEEIIQYQNKIRFMAGAGISYVWNKSLKIGFSMPELVKTENEFYPTMFGNASYKHFLGKSNVFIEPAALFYTTSFTPATVEGSVKAGYKEYAWLKVGGRSSKTLVVGAGGGYKIINIGYSYNRNFGEYSLINESQHNVNVYFNFLQAGKSKKQKELSAIEEQVSVLNDVTSNSVATEDLVSGNKIPTEESLKTVNNGVGGQSLSNKLDNDDNNLGSAEYQSTNVTETVKEKVEDDVDILNSLSKGRDEYVYRSKLTGEKTAKYFIVVGSYAKLENANKKIYSLSQENVIAYIMTEVNSDILRICVQDGEEFEDVLNKLNTVRNSFEPDAWIIRNE